MAISILGLEFFVQKIPTDQGWSILKVSGIMIKKQTLFWIKKTKI